MAYSKDLNDQSHQKGHGQYEAYQRCDLCNVPVFRNPCSDARSSNVFNGKGKLLCNKCAEILSNMPNEQALKALDNASETYPKQ